jgi:hypothetical protein
MFHENWEGDDDSLGLPTFPLKLHIFDLLPAGRFTDIRSPLGLQGHGKIIPSGKLT